MSGKSSKKNKKVWRMVMKPEGSENAYSYCFYDNSADAVTGIYLCSVFGNV